MQNDVLKNQIAPWQEKGRWYHGAFNNNGLIQNETDLFLYSDFLLDGSGNDWRIGQRSSSFAVKKMRIMDVKCFESDDYTASSNVTSQISDYIYANGRRYAYLHTKAATGKVDFWIFIR